VPLGRPPPAGCLPASSSLTPNAHMSPIRNWNVRQLGVFQRYCSMHHVPLTPDLVARLAARYAEKHRGHRPWVEGGRREWRAATAGGSPAAC
jgi:hypothetical protein